MLTEVARQHTSEGAAAFTTYWFELANWSLKSGEIETLRSVSDAECEYCGGFIEGVSARAQEDVRLEGGGASATEFGEGQELSDGSFILDLTYSEQAGKLIRPDGSVYFEWKRVDPVARQVVVEWSDGHGWSMGGFGARVECIDCE